MLSVRLTASPSIIATKSGRTQTPGLEGSKRAIVISDAECRKRLLGTTRVFAQKKKDAMRADLSRAGGIERIGRFRNPSLESTLNGMSKWLVGALFALAIPLKHDAVTVWAAVGTFVNSWVSTKLKKILKQERPSSLRSDPGMPSSHAQSIFYAVAFSIFSVMEWIGFNLISVSAGAAILICGAYLSWLRVSQQLHTIKQVIAGAALGSACSLIWLWMWHSFVIRAFVSSIFVRAIIFLGALTYYFVLMLYAIRHWHLDEGLK